MYYPEHSKLFKEVLEQLKGKKVVVLTHLRPDGDAIGSQVAMCRILNGFGIDARCLLPEKVPSHLAFLIKDTPLSYLSEIENKSEFIAVMVDCGNAIRAGKEIVEAFKEIELSVDHHISNDNFAKNNILEVKTSATTEILAQLFLDNELKIDAIAAQALYVGMATDTGQFRYPTTTARVFEICGKLIELGANPGEASFELYENDPIEKVMLLQEFLASLKTEMLGKVCVGFITKEMLRKSGARREHLEGFVNYTRSIQGVEIGALIEETDEGVKGSLRAVSGNLRVDLLADKLGSGGGHAAAAGFRSGGTIEIFYPKFLKIVEEHLKENK